MEPLVEGLDYNMGRAAFMAVEVSEAVAPLSRYLRSHPADSGIRGALAMSQFMTHDYASCHRVQLKGAGDSISSIPQMQYIYADSLVKTGQVSPGKSAWKSWRPRIPRFPRCIERWASRGALKATGRRP